MARTSRLTAPSSTPPSPATNPASANAVSLARAGETVSAAARQLVLAHADDRAPDAGAPEVSDEQEHDDEHEQHEVVVGAVPVRELERAEVGAGICTVERPPVKNGRSKR